LYIYEHEIDGLFAKYNSRVRGSAASVTKAVWKMFLQDCAMVQLVVFTLLLVFFLSCCYFLTDKALYAKKLKNYP